MAHKGDLIYVNAQRVGGSPRQGEIIEVIEGELRLSYRVRWSDGRETLLAPAAGAVKIEPAKPPAKKVGSAKTRSTKSPGTTSRKKSAGGKTL